MTPTKNESLPELDDVVTDPAIAARLPHAGPWLFRLHWFVIRDAWRALKRRDRSGIRYFIFPNTVRCANFKTYRWLIFYIQRPMPWLLWPAQQLHPEVFRKTTEIRPHD
jgi:hypothetical protein